MNIKENMLSEEELESVLGGYTVNPHINIFGISTIDVELEPEESAALALSDALSKYNIYISDPNGYMNQVPQTLDREDNIHKHRKCVIHFTLSGLSSATITQVDIMF